MAERKNADYDPVKDELTKILENQENEIDDVITEETDNIRYDVEKPETEREENDELYDFLDDEEWIKNNPFLHDNESAKLPDLKNEMMKKNITHIQTIIKNKPEIEELKYKLFLLDEFLEKEGLIIFNKEPEYFNGDCYILIENNKGFKRNAHVYEYFSLMEFRVIEVSRRWAKKGMLYCCPLKRSKEIFIVRIDLNSAFFNPKKVRNTNGESEFEY